MAAFGMQLAPSVQIHPVSCLLRAPLTSLIGPNSKRKKKGIYILERSLFKYICASHCRTPQEKGG